ncbi:Csn9p KNAG_0A04790 [Huiozyma naganishii CBS 8797]|uniref:PCI domain-containing protein n=1 Tax=Huiozyma naganishii (strain ATCC MYA-139 / BCRC 22969 / CBS 8797 / KCTC 17520 / NBRC 10181 / NCYC 3082 / Yp74L-3) TaxID=1071383 RepID=J7S2F5_HUIN7|nr:hypothetical protein KNAG_0A04790 [Kazachstania naganishii CBS 8797]CCK68149.1 hypothetical protein KNAG_0A04790 [Kazachstania naganishii CBS 8797]
MWGSIDEQRLVRILEDPQKLHYKDEWIHVAAGDSRARGSRARDLLEIFTFGTVEDVPASIELSERMLHKLRKLTLLSLTELYRVIPYSFALEKCQMSDRSLMETYFIQLGSVLEFQMDPISETVTVTNFFDCRDVYDNEAELRIVRNAHYTREQLVTGLQKWKLKLENEILPSQS